MVNMYASTDTFGRKHNFRKTQLLLPEISVSKNGINLLITFRNQNKIILPWDLKIASNSFDRRVYDRVESFSINHKHFQITFLNTQQPAIISRAKIKSFLQWWSIAADIPQFLCELDTVRKN